MAEVALSVRLLGMPEVVRDGRAVRLPSSCTALLALLLLDRGRSYPRPVLAGLLAGDQPEDGSRRRLNTTVWRLRRALEPDDQPRDTVIVTRESGISVSPACRVCLDVERFESALRPRVARPARRWSAEDVAAVAAAVDLYRGDLLPGVYDDWVLGARARLADLHLAALIGLVEWHRAAGRTDRVVEYGERALAREPLREDVHRHLIAAYASAGQRDLATRQFERCRRLLAAELGVDPMPETVALAARVVRGAAAPPAPPTVDIAALIADLEQARSEVARLGQLLERSLAALRRENGPRPPENGARLPEGSTRPPENGARPAENGAESGVRPPDSGGPPQRGDRAVIGVSGR